MGESTDIKHATPKAAAVLAASSVAVLSVPSWVTVPLWCIALCASALVRVPVPFSDVPMTLQLLAVLLAGFALSPGRAVAAVLMYLACGVVGLPVFAGTGGLFGATGGYLIGFLIAAWVVSVLKGHRHASLARLVAVAMAGTTVVFALGVAWLTGFYRGNVMFAVTSGLAPFLVKGLIEAGLAVAMVRSARALRPDRRSTGVNRRCAADSSG